jgi:hypothetical protein
MIGTGKATHLRAHFRDDHFGRRAGHPRNRLQQANRGFKGGAHLFDLSIEARNGLSEAIDLTSQLGQHNAMMGFDAAISRFRQLVSCAAQATLGQVCQRLRGSVTGTQGRQHRSP